MSRYDLSRWGFALGLLCLYAGAAGADEKQAVAGIKRLGGEPIHVGLDASRPVFNVEFNHNPRFNDANLKEAIGYLKQLPDLRRLSLSSTKVTDKGLAYLKDLDRLEDLVLVQTGITDAGLKHLQQMPNLKSVNLILSKVTDRGAADLKKALPKAEVFLRIGK